MDPSAAKQPPHPIFELEASSTLWMTKLGLALIAVLVVLACVLFLIGRRRRKAKAPRSSDPWDLLKDRLIKLEWRELPPEDYFGALSFTLREALERRLGKPFSAWTRREVLKELQTRPDFSSDFQAECAEFLETAERVIYAGAEVDETSASAWKDRIGQCLETLKREPLT